MAILNAPSVLNALAQLKAQRSEKKSVLTHFLSSVAHKDSYQTTLIGIYLPQEKKTPQEPHVGQPSAKDRILSKHASQKLLSAFHVRSLFVFTSVVSTMEHPDTEIGLSTVMLTARYEHVTCTLRSLH